MLSVAGALLRISTLLAVSLGPAAAAAAQTADYPPDEGGLEVSRTALRAGAALQAAASGFCPERGVRVSLVPQTPRSGAQPAVEPASAPADAEGDVSVSVTIPRATEPGAYELTLKGLGSDCRQAKVVRSRVEVLGVHAGGSGEAPGAGKKGSDPTATGPPDGDAAPGGDLAGSPWSDGVAPGNAPASLTDSADEGGYGSSGLAFTGLNVVLPIGAALILLAGGLLLRRRSAVSPR